VNVLTCGRPRRRTGAFLLGSTLYALMICCDAPAYGGATTRGGDGGDELTDP